MNRFAVVTEVPADLRRARVYEFGWQSWSPTGVYPASARSPRPPQAWRQTSGYRPGRPAPPAGFQGEGLLAVQADPDAPVHLVALPDHGGAVPTIRAEATGDRLLVSADGPVEVTVDPGPGGLYGALSRFADRYAVRAGVGQIRPCPPAWASWYHYFTEFTHADLVENLRAMDDLALPIEVVRVDDAFQAGIGDWLELSDGFDSLPGFVGRIRDTGRRAGLWIAPLLVGAESRLFHDHPDWVVRAPDGSPLVALHNWGQDCFPLDVTHPAAAAYLRTVLETWVAHGASYLMVDFMFAGALDGRRHRADVDGLQAYRDGLRLIRDAIGPETYLQGCGAPMFPSVGLVDSMRVGPDVALDWEPAGGDMSRPGLAPAAATSIGRAFTQGRFWVNDADCLIVRPEIPRRREWAAVVAAVSGARISSDRLTALDGPGVELTRELLSGATDRPFVGQSVTGQLLTHP
ncbi:MULTISPECIES: glycoside hydrolase family 36 protein [unclassified Micromonospora]|uniref:glycoside hydrolase family 36 protein n=1 Tax=unclassified Micromonospora TaxID=2617518 RepID=UPI0022C6DB91|nr:glycoside hydrolase family 36 protein [Micromonospora sp. AKA38]GHJ15921.1 hypothetical protein TPA0908_39160 [Micromonospora sp. AKA38]